MGLRARWGHTNWGVGRNREPCGAWRRPKETESSVSWTSWRRSHPGRGDRVRPIALGDGNRGRRTIQGVSWWSSSRWAGGNNELWGRRWRRFRGSRRSGERWRRPLGCIQRHRLRTNTSVQTVDNIVEVIDKNDLTIIH